DKDPICWLSARIDHAAAAKASKWDPCRAASCGAQIIVVRSEACATLSSAGMRMQPAAGSQGCPSYCAAIASRLRPALSLHRSLSPTPANTAREQFGKPNPTRAGKDGKVNWRRGCPQIGRAHV